MPGLSLRPGCSAQIICAGDGSRRQLIHWYALLPLRQSASICLMRSMCWQVWNTGELLGLKAGRKGKPQGTGKLSVLSAVAAHDKEINALAISPNDSLLCSASQDRTARVRVAACSPPSRDSFFFHRRLLAKCASPYRPPLLLDQRWLAAFLSVGPFFFMLCMHSTCCSICSLFLLPSSSADRCQIRMPKLLHADMAAAQSGGRCCAAGSQKGCLGSTVCPTRKDHRHSIG